MKKLLALLLLFGIVGCSYSEEEKQMIELEKVEMTDLLQEIVECSATEGNVYINHRNTKQCYSENMGALIIKSNLDEIQFDCYFNEVPSCRIVKGLEFISSPFREGYRGLGPSDGICLDVNEVGAVHKCVDRSMKDRFIKNLDTLDDWEVSRDIGHNVENACAYSFNKALRPYDYVIKEGILRHTRLKSKESEELALEISKKTGNIEKGLYHCECILYDYISKKDYSRGLISRNYSVGSGYKCNGPVMIKE
jgi:hypothetical protein